jgi:hypothetical protein
MTLLLQTRTSFYIHTHTIYRPRYSHPSFNFSLWYLLRLRFCVYWPYHPLLSRKTNTADFGVFRKKGVGADSNKRPRTPGSPEESRPSKIPVTSLLDRSLSSSSPPPHPGWVWWCGKCLCADNPGQNANSMDERICGNPTVVQKASATHKERVQRCLQEFKLGRDIMRLKAPGDMSQNAKPILTKSFKRGSIPWFDGPWNGDFGWWNARPNVNDIMSKWFCCECRKRTLTNVPVTPTFAEGRIMETCLAHYKNPRGNWPRCNHVPCKKPDGCGVSAHQPGPAPPSKTQDSQFQHL